MVCSYANAGVVRKNLALWMKALADRTARDTIKLLFDPAYYLDRKRPFQVGPCSGLDVVPLGFVPLFEFVDGAFHPLPYVAREPGKLFLGFTR